MIRKKHDNRDPDFMNEPEERTQKELNDFMLNGGDISELHWDDRNHKLVKIPQDIINERLSNGYDCGWVDPEKFAAIPYPIRVFTDQAKDALRHFENNEISFDDLPADVFVNAEARRELMNIIDSQYIEKFDAICEKHGFDVKVPPVKVMKKFDNIMLSVSEKISEKKQKYLKKVKKLSRKEKSDIKSSLSDMDDEFDL